ncbi:TonB-dependent receptor [Campylobacter sp. RM16192]|uniref:TonB-dependent receptor n=1 Tax=Campylobacter sp. RM16192 TaxID=1660080 RepID=UPI001451C187|nr:TonB-dependent receptor [Campylobacter sp. RM16192]QCD52188.1 TonB-dependent receptor [Campylobacter sp. RM16192]
MDKSSKAGKIAIIVSFAVAMNLHAAENKNTKLEKTIITSTGFETQLKDEVKNAYIITSEEIKDRGYKSVTEVLERAPGVYISNADIFGSEKIDMRGQGAYAHTNVKTLINGVNLNVIKTAHSGINTPLNLIAVEDIEKIEIIPGGGAVLYGGGTAGGVVNIITKKKPRDFYLNASSKIASYNYKDAVIGIGGLVNDDLFLKFSAKAFDSKGYRKKEETNGYYINGGINYQISDNQSIAITPSFYSQKYKNQSGALTKKQVNEDRRQSSKLSDPKVYKKFDITLDYSLKLSDSYEINFMPYYLYTKFKKESKKEEVFSDKKVGANLKNRFTYDKGELIFGYNYEDVYDKIQNKDELGKEIHSVYFFEKHNFTDVFSFNFGGRYERALYDIKRPFSPRFKRPASNSKKNTNSYAFEITPNFKYSDTGNVYLKFEKGFVSPSPQELVDNIKIGPDNYEFQLNNLKSETFYTYEVGFKDIFFDQFFSAAIFYTDTKNMIYRRWTDYNMAHGNFEGKWINIDKAKRYGFEIYAEQYLLDNKLKLTESYSRVSTKATLQDGDNNTYEEKTTRGELTGVAKEKFVLGADYAPIKNLNLYADLKYYSKILNQKREKMSSKTLVDISAKYHFTKNISVVAGIKNLFDKKYYSYYETTGKGSYYPAPERNYYLEFKYNY